jgi:hypothetical protein
MAAFRVFLDTPHEERLELPGPILGALNYGPAS